MMKLSEVKKLAQRGDLDEAWIGFGRDRVFAKTATWDDTTSQVRIVDLEDRVHMVVPEQINSIRH